MSKGQRVCILGLGNTGSKYADTRHNAGFWLIDLLYAFVEEGISFEGFCPGYTVAEGFFSSKLKCSYAKLNSNKLKSVALRALEKKKCFDKIQKLESLELPEVFLVKPNSYMNLSGQAFRGVYDFFKFSISNLLVVHDELELAPGKIKFKKGGGLSGHNGLRDLASVLGTNEFNRLRIGIGRPNIDKNGRNEHVSDWVLSKPGFSEEELLKASLVESACAVLCFSLLGIDEAMREFH